MFIIFMYELCLCYRDGPNIIYTKEMQLQEAFANKHKEYIEDLENGYDRIATLHHHRKEQDNDSIRRHEIDRGSEDGDYVGSGADKNIQDKVEHNLKRESDKHAPSSLGRDQYFIKEGNTEILRLVTRGKTEEERYVNLPVHTQRPVTLIPHTQYVVVDNGKELLMERFIREQGEEASNIRERMDKIVTDLDDISNGKDSKSVGQRFKADVENQNQSNEYSNLRLDVPGAVPLKSDYLHSALIEIQNKSSIHQELLESSLRKQNELLHQILIERDRMLQNQETASQVESKLETQSLPGHSVMATQTECHIGTQTEADFTTEVKRKSRSDNDSYSEDESQTSTDHLKKIAWVKKKKPKKKIKYKEPRRSIRIYELKRKIKTPIIEESDVSPSLESEKRVKISKTNEREERIKHYGDVTKSTITTSKNETMSSTQIKSSETDRKPKIRREVLMEISDSLDEKIGSDSVDKNMKLEKGSYTTNDNVTRDVQENDSSQSVGNLASKDERNFIFSRQGSSTEEKDRSVNQTTAKLKTKVSFPNVSEESDRTFSAKIDLENESGKGNEPAKPLQKSLPRYMQWYNKKPNTTTKSTSSEKTVPEKPKRPSKTKTDSDKESKEKNGRYGKIINKESQNQTAETKKNYKESEFIHPRILKEGKVTPVPEGPLPDVHPLLQHSEHRYEHQYENQNPLCYIQPTHIPKYLGGPSNIPVLPRRQSLEQQPIYVNQDEVKNKEKQQEISESALTHSISISSNYEEGKKTAPEVHVSKINIGGNSVVDINQRKATSKIDDNDSGIAMSTLVQQAGNIKRLPITEKKSVFTIAYDDVQTKQLRPDSSSTSY